MFDFKLILPMIEARIKAFTGELKKQNDVNLLANITAQIYYNPKCDSTVNECCLKAKEIINTAKTIVGA